MRRGLLGERYAAVAFSLPVVGFVCTAVCLGCCNYMVAVFARAVAPQSMGSLTSITRCSFTIGNAVLCVRPPSHAYTAWSSRVARAPSQPALRACAARALNERWALAARPVQANRH